MRKIITISIALVLTVLISFAKDTSVDWVKKYSPVYQAAYWLTNHDSVAVILAESQNDSIYYKYGNPTLQFWDLTTAKLMKEVKTDSDFPNQKWIYSDENHEFASISAETATFVNLDDPQNKLEVNTGFEADYHGDEWIRFDKKNGNYVVICQNNDSLRFFVISGTEHQIIGDYWYFASGTSKPQFIDCQNGKIVLLVDTNKVTVLSTDDFSKIDSLINPTAMYGLKLSSTGRYILYNKAPNKLLLIDFDNKINISEYTSNNYNFTYTLSNDDKYLLMETLQGYSTIDVQQKKQIYNLSTGYPSGYASFCVNNEQVFEFGASLAVPRVFKIDNSQFIGFCGERRQQYNLNLNAIAVGKDENTFYSTGYPYMLSEISVDSGIVRKAFPLNFEYHNFINSELKDTLVLYNDRSILIWDKVSDNIIDSISLDLTGLSKPKISNDLRWIASQTKGKGLILIDANNNKRYYLNSGRKASQAYDFSSDSKFLAEGGSGNELKIFDLTKFEQDTTPILTIMASNAHNQMDDDSIGLVYVKFFKNNSVLLAGSVGDQSLKVWNSNSGDLVFNSELPDSLSNFWLNYWETVDFYYRDQFDDYVSYSYGQILYWDNKFEINKNIPPYNVYMDPTGGPPNYWVYHVYYPERNKLIIGSQNYGFLASVSLADPTDAVNDRPEELGCKIYPNPAHDELWIDVPNDAAQSHVEIVNLLGETVISEPFASHIIVANLSAGVYFVRIGDKMYPFVKQ